MFAAWLWLARKLTIRKSHFVAQNNHFGWIVPYGTLSWLIMNRRAVEARVDRSKTTMLFLLHRPTVVG